MQVDDDDEESGGDGHMQRELQLLGSALRRQHATDGAEQSDKHALLPVVVIPSSDTENDSSLSSLSSLAVGKESDIEIVVPALPARRHGQSTAPRDMQVVVDWLDSSDSIAPLSPARAVAAQQLPPQPQLQVDDEPPAEATQRRRRKKPADDKDGAAKDKPRAAKKSRTYIPAYRSGGYAILVALYQAGLSTEEEEGGQARICQMTKQELVEIAQPYSDISFGSSLKPLMDHAGEVAGRGRRQWQGQQRNGGAGGAQRWPKYSAWSAMPRLLKHGLVETSQPAALHPDQAAARRKPTRGTRYWLSSAGRDLAEKLWSAQPGMSGNASLPQQANAAELSDVTMDADTGFLVDGDALPLSPRASSSSNVVDVLVPTAASLSPPPYAWSDDDDDAIVNMASEADVVQQPLDKGKEKASSTPIVLTIDSDSDHLPLANVPFQASKTRTQPRPALLQPSRGSNDENVTSQAASDNTVSIPEQPLQCLPAGSYNIVLVLDSREVARARDRAFFQHQLEQLGIRVLTRALQVGDVIWMAVPKPTFGDSVGAADDREERRRPPQQAEVVLDCIIERKRLSDLCASIKDNRWKEQKWRLAQSGIPQRIYLIEDPNGVTFASATTSARTAKAVQTLGLGPTGVQAIRTALTQTVLWSGCMLHRTSSADETVQYLARLTREIERQWAGQPVWYLPSGAVTERSAWQDMRMRGTVDPGTAMLRPITNNRQAHQQEHYPGATASVTKAPHIVYETFTALNTKSKRLTLSDVFVHLLLRVRGNSQEKARFIAKQYGTPSRLLEAYAEQPDHKARQGMLHKTCEELERSSGVPLGRRKIGKAQSAVIADIWSLRSYPPRAPAATAVAANEDDK
ncbi:Crossover junction endonuclease mus81 [Sorochytrium milnesiophthora]